jgi:hypothetical protein
MLEDIAVALAVVLLLGNSSANWENRDFWSKWNVVKLLILGIIVVL